MKYQDFIGLAQALFEESGEALILLDGNADQILDANAAVQRLCGLSLRQLLASPIGELFQFDDRRDLRSILQADPMAHGPLSIGRCQVRTNVRDVWMHVELTMTRLLVRPQQLIQLTVRLPQANSRIPNYFDAASFHSLCSSCGAPLDFADAGRKTAGSDVEPLTICSSTLLGHELHN